MSSIQENSVVYYKDDQSKHPYLAHQVLDDNNVILGLKEFPEIEQDWAVSIDKISLFKTQEEEDLARELIQKLLD
jgi:hypothetical protein